MTVHKEGYATIFVALLFFIAINVAGYCYASEATFKIIALASTVGFVLIASFFRWPKRRPTTVFPDAIIAPADGKIVVIEEVYEPEVLKCQCLQVSIFMSVFNVHINWYPISGMIKYSRHHNGKFQAAYLPKSSTENERTSIVIEQENGTQVLVRQVAGALARRIVSYAKENYRAKQANQMGFIKFGSRVDLYLPLGTKIDVNLDDKVTGSQTIIGWLK